MQKSTGFVGLGVALGAAIGTATGNVPVGVALGIVFGTGISIAKTWRTAPHQTSKN